MCVFFFKQKTAYEMRSSDWSSDVCSSDLVAPCAIVTPQYLEIEKSNPELIAKVVGVIPAGRAGTEEEVASMVAYLARDEAGFVTGQVVSELGRASCRERVCQYV